MTSPFELEFGLLDYKEATDIYQVTTIPQLRGDSGSNLLYGTEGSNTFRAGGGDDLIITIGGSNLIDGGSGVDTIDYLSASFSAYSGNAKEKGVIANLNKGSGLNSFGEVDRYVSVENVEGSIFKDRLVGNNGNNTLAGWDGNDRLLGKGGDDILAGGLGSDILTGGRGRDKFVFDFNSSDADFITDFTPGTDKIVIIEHLFAEYGQALSISDFSYNSGNGQLRFTPPGIISDSLSLIATLTNTPSDFSVSDISIV